MALTILPQQQSFGSSFGSGLGAGLAQGTQGILEHLQKKQDHATSVRRLIEAGVPEYEANIIAQFRPQEQAALYSKFLESGGGPLANLVQTPQVGAEGLVDKLGASRAPEGPKPEERAPEAIGSMRTGERPRSVGEALQAQKSEAQRQQAEKESRKEQVAIDKDTKKYYENIKESVKNSEDNIKRLDRMEKLIKKGDIPPAVLYKLVHGLETVGEGGHGVLGNIVGSAVGLVTKPLGTLFRYSLIKDYPDLEEFEKLSNDFVKGAKQFYGARLTDTDLKQFMQTVPTLSQTNRGKEAVIRNLRNMAMIDIAKNSVMKEVIKENGGRRPPNIQELVEARISPLKDELAEDFREGFIQGGINKSKKEYDPLVLTREK